MIVCVCVCVCRYGEQTLVLLRSIAKSQGLDCIHYANAFSDYFGDGELEWSCVCVCVCV